MFFWDNFNLKREWKREKGGGGEKGRRISEKFGEGGGIFLYCECFFMFLIFYGEDMIRKNDKNLFLNNFYGRGWEKKVFG